VLRLFALDQNFPQPIVDALADYIVEAELVPIAQIDQRLPTLDDWEVLLALHHHERPWDGLITTDANMLALPRELAVLMQTRLTLVVAKEAGHDPIKATGLLLAYLPGICERTDPGKPQLWTLRAVGRNADNPWEKFEAVARRRGTTASRLYATNKLNVEGLENNPLAH
jgi:hypothetical protein